MNTSGFFAKFFTIPIVNLLVLFYFFLAFLRVPFALGFSIILLTIFIRIILYPFISSQMRVAEKMKKIQPHIKNLQDKYKSDRKKQNEEMMRLYKEHNVNPAAGCLPALVQLPVIISLYNVLMNIVSVNSLEAINKINSILYFPFLKITNLWDTNFFGFPLFSTPANLFKSHPLILVIPVVTFLFQFVSSKMMMPEKPHDDKQKKDDFQSAFATQSLYIFPVMIGYFSFTLPMGLSLYWNTFTLFGILQQYNLAGTGGLAPIISKIKNIIWKSNLNK